MSKSQDHTTTDRTMAQTAGERQLARQQSMQASGPPAKVPDVEPERFLGAGAYGQVWVGTSRKTGRRVAVKFYTHRGGLDWTLLAREVEKLSFLFGNRYVVQLLDVGWDSDPPYYVMEFMARGSLEDRLSRGPLPVGEALTILRDVATGLIHAHGKGVLHCDLKPANVLIGDDGKPRLADFGQSRLTTEQQPALGTLFYMAPEQADLKAIPDVRWDVYALGALLYRMLTGEAPYSSEQAKQEIRQVTDLEQRLKRYREWIRHAPPPKAHRHVPGVDRSLGDIIQRCLAYDPKRRFANVQALLEALDERNRRMARRPLLVLGALGPAMLLIVMSWFAWAGYRASIGESERTVVRRVLESNRFAAQFVAETVARQIDQRWRVLEIEAGKPGFASLIEEASTQPLDSPARQRLQSRIEALRAQYAEIESTSWFVDARDGRQLARSPLDKKTIDRNYAFRDYFHGQGYDLAPGASDVAPIRKPHRSIVFTSHATGNRMVAFSVPVFGAADEQGNQAVVGVLAMTVELGKFAELHPGNRATSSQIAVLIDSREDAQRRAGAVLEHPYLAHLLETGRSLPATYLDAREVQHLLRMRPLKQRLQKWHAMTHGLAGNDSATANTGSPDAPGDNGKKKASHRRVSSNEEKPGVEEGLATAEIEAATEELKQLAYLSDYQDPFGSIDSHYHGRWLAAVDPVFIEGRDSDVRDTGWVVIVQERYDRALEPVRRLGTQLVRQWLVALGTVAAVVTALWGVVVVLLDDSRRFRFVSALRRRFGIPEPPSTEPPTTATFQSPDASSAD